VDSWTAQPILRATSAEGVGDSDFDALGDVERRIRGEPA
jgi:hypothetical protein